jgi:hypothetical protein
LLGFQALQVDPSPDDGYSQVAQSRRRDGWTGLWRDAARARTPFVISVLPAEGEAGLAVSRSFAPSFDATTEVLNVIAKTLWALGFLLPLLRQTSTDERVAAPQAAGAPPQAL